MTAVPKAVESAASLTIEDARAAKAELEEFLYLVSHDLRAPLRALRILPVWLRDDISARGISIEGDIGDSLDMLEQQAARMDRLLIDLLELSRAGRQMADPTVLPLTPVLRDAVSRNVPRDRFEVLIDAADLTLQIASVDLTRCLDALLSNAVKHHDRASGEIVVTATEHGGEAVIEITDDGPGIAPEFQDRVFRPCETLRPRDECEGSGLGLTIARKTARRCGGDVVLFSEGRGARLRLVLPMGGARTG